MTTVIRAGSPEARAAQAAGTYVYIGRPSKWGNPFVIGQDGTRAEVVRKFGTHWYNTGQASLRENAITELKDKMLGCYCAPRACHGDIIATYVNEHNARHTTVTAE